MAATALRAASQRDENDRRESLTAKGLVPIKATISIRPSTVAPTQISPGPLSPPAPSLVCSGGPTSGTTTILPRPKPGRKPASDEPENKRKAQNRAAQRAFRERKLQGQQQLEFENKDLKTSNDELSRQIQQLQKELKEGKANQARLDSELTASIRRENDLKAQHDRDLAGMSTFEQRTREAEHKTANYLNELHTLRAEVAILRAKVGRPLRHADKREASVPPANITNPIGGCDDCGKDGTCPCVDTYLEADEPTKNSRHSMPIESMLSPPDSASDPARMNSIPELVSDHSSPEDMEIDFTHAFKPAKDHRLAKADRCGFCEDGGTCICAEAEAQAELDLPLSQPLPAIPLPSKTITAAAPKTTKPGTCAQCQANPEQKAYCESLAASRLADRPTLEGEPASKRTRTSTSVSNSKNNRDLSVPCADAYELFKRYASSKESPSYDEVYQEYTRTHPTTAGARRPRAATAVEQSVGKEKGFSAYEVDVAAVIATLHQAPAGSTSTSSSSVRTRRAPKG